MSSRSGLLAALILVLGTPALRGEDLPHYKPDQLVLYSDVALLATEVSATELRVEKVLAGQWQGNFFEIGIREPEFFPVPLSLNQAHLAGVTIQSIAQDGAQTGVLVEIKH